jgi:hypothetical protein
MDSPDIGNHEPPYVWPCASELAVEDSEIAFVERVVRQGGPIDDEEDKAFRIILAKLAPTDLTPALRRKVQLLRDRLKI